MSFSQQTAYVQKSYEDLREHPPKKGKEILGLKDYFVIALLCFNNLLMSSSYSLQGPFFPKEAELKGATPAQYGFIFGVFELVVILVAPICSKLVVYVRPHFTANLGIFLCGLSAIVFGFIKYSPPGTTFIALAFLIRIFEGVGMALFTNSAFNIVSTEYPDYVTALFALLEGGFGIGITIGPLIGGLLYEVGGFVLPFFVTGCVMLLGGGIQIFLPLKRTALPHETGSWKKFLGDPGLLLAALAIVSGCMVAGFNGATLEPYLRQFNMTTAIVSVFFVISGGVYAVFAPILGSLLDKGANPYIFLYSGCLMLIIFYIFVGPIPFLPFPPNQWVIAACLVAMGLGMAFKIVSGLSLIFFNTRERGLPQDLATQAMISTTMFTCCSFGAFIGPSLGGVLVEHLDYRYATFVLLIIEVSTEMLYVVYAIYKKCRRPPHPETLPILRQSNSYTS